MDVLAPVVLEDAFPRPGVVLAADAAVFIRSAGSVQALLDQHARDGGDDRGNAHPDNLRGGGREARREDARGERSTREIMTRVSRSEKHRSAGRVRRRPVPRSCLRRTWACCCFSNGLFFPASRRLARLLTARRRSAIFSVFLLGLCPRGVARREIRRFGNHGDLEIRGNSRNFSVRLMSRRHFVVYESSSKKDGGQSQPF